MKLAQRYAALLAAGRDEEAERIEQEHGVFGYPPELVSVCLGAIDEDRDPERALESYLGGETP